ncbi:hypothetical protein [Paractinoplanes rishiriensis]|uniref:Uncharacterized protein n=1 Tax=Paractinoplanes rishiriensis TaxID=1050105 RepID=A0A919JWN4_9ACTN|nr:hypothetical protein [Actinoplanes rishiriensis]GIE94639.1 hypothetical protein Ari01nite_21040 [Actinoplanes rishiriensis]
MSRPITEDTACVVDLDLTNGPAFVVGDAGMLGEFVEGDLFRAEAIVVGAHDYDTQIGGHTVAPKLQVTSIKAVSDK